MVKSCMVVGCNTHSKRTENANFFRIPQIISIDNKFYERHSVDMNALHELSKRRHEAWVRAIKRGNFTETQLNNGRVCHKHFISGKPAEIHDQNNPDWVPSQNLGYDIGFAVKRKSDLERHNRCVKRAKNRNEAALQNNGTEHEVQADVNDEFHDEIYDEIHDEVHDEVEDQAYSGIEIQTDLTMDTLADVFKKLIISEGLIPQLQEKISQFSLGPESFFGDDVKTKYFTGLSSYKQLFILHETIAPFLSQSNLTALSTFQQLILTLMKLRLNLPMQYLSYRFGVTVFTVGRYFRRCLNAMYCMLKRLIHWPDRDTLRSTMPACFREMFGEKITVIIDCFEVFIESPSHLHSSAECWSSYKHHKTAKNLIGVTPQGTVCFISESWGGRASDKFITENCGFLEHIQPGDVVLADRGFLIHDSIQSIKAELKIPAFTKGKSQLHPVDLEETRRKANLRIHVERIIGSIRQKYSILSGTIPISMLTPTANGNSVYDQIVCVCCALVNLCPSMVSLE